jgi:hypothetical protein
MPKKIDAAVRKCAIRLLMEPGGCRAPLISSRTVNIFLSLVHQYIRGLG